MAYTEEQIEKWKKEYGSIYSVTVADTQFIFKTLSRDDYINISLKQAANPSGFDHEFVTVSTCLISDYDPDSLKKKAGICTIIYDKIMSKSGFQEVEAEEL
jgi:hypothetical protein